MEDTRLMRPHIPVGISGYGSYIPMYRLPNAEISRVWGDGSRGPIQEKAVAGLDEDTVTIAIEAALEIGPFNDGNPDTPRGGRERHRSLPHLSRRRADRLRQTFPRSGTKRRRSASDSGRLRVERRRFP